MKKTFISLIFGVLLLVTELAYWLGYHFRQDTGGTGNCVVLILGYPTQDDGRDHPIQRLRVETGVAAYQANRCARIVISGGAVQNTYVEAESMAKLARIFGIPDHDLILETHATTTWENIGCSMSYLAKYERIFVVSDSLHAHRGKRYVCRQNPSLCAKTFATGNNPAITLFWWKIPAAAHELFAWMRDLIIYEPAKLNNTVKCPPIE